jgi:beta-N-acetylhexosaminidase
MTVPRSLMASLLVSLPGPELPAHAARWLEDGLGGVVLFARNIESPESLRRLCRSVRDIRPDALITLDEEGGEVTRLEAATGSSFPGARVLGVVDDVALTERVAGVIAGEIAAAGANINLAPVADVPTGAGDPVIGNRAFGEDPELVGRHAAAFVRGTQAAGVAACAKHAPGHGAATVDSHLGLPVVELDRQTLVRDHLAAFGEPVSAGVAMLMTAHVVYAAIDDRPATISPRVLETLVREELGFDGVVVTDALTMGAIAGSVGVVAGAVAALSAGADLLCVDGDPERQSQVIAGLGAAAAAGEIKATRVAQAATRVAELATRYPLPLGTAAGRPQADRQALGLEAARRALSTFALPAPLPGAPYVVELRAVATGVGNVRSRLVDAFLQRDTGTRGEAFPPDALPDVADVLGAAGGQPIVIGARDAWRRPGQASLIAAVLAERPDTVVVGLGSAADAALAPGHFVPAGGAAPPNVRAVADVLLPP